jgi:hypothetical protein
VHCPPLSPFERTHQLPLKSRSPLPLLHPCVQVVRPHGGYVLLTALFSRSCTLFPSPPWLADLWEQITTNNRKEITEQRANARGLPIASWPLLTRLFAPSSFWASAHTQGTSSRSTRRWRA